MFIASDRKKYLSLDVIGQLEDELEHNPLDYEKWMKLIKQVMLKDKEEQVRSVMNKYLSIFKFDGDQWCSYINYEIDRSEFNNVEQLFKKCLAVTTHVGLFRLYVSYVRRVNDVITGGENSRRIVIEAFQFAVDNVGIDIKSSDLWEDYLEFLKSWTPTATWEQQQKNDLIRKVYKRLLLIPTEKLESIWPEYTNWENEVNPITAKKFIGEKSANYMLARSWYTEWNNVTESKLQRSPIIPFTLQNNPDVIKKQLSFWAKWIELEKKNKLELKDEKQLQQRLDYVHRQALTVLPFVPELWFKCNKFWLNSNEDANLNKCIELLNESLILNPRSALLSFQLSELYEKDDSNNKSTETFNKLIEILIQDYKEVEEQIEKITTQRYEEKENNKDKEAKSKEDNEDKDDDDDEDDEINYTSQESYLNKMSAQDVDKLSKLEKRKEDLNKTITYVYTKLMTARKRSSGIKEARNVFKNAKQNFKSIGYKFYVDNALLEYYSDNPKVASKVFELGMKRFNKYGGFLLSYLDYLIMINDVENIRVLFEQGLTALLKEITSDSESSDGISSSITGANSNSSSNSNKAPGIRYMEKLKEDAINEKKENIRELFKRFSQFQTRYGDLSAVRSLEKRYEQYFPNDDTMVLFCDRYHEPGTIDVIRKYDLGTDGGDSKRRKTTGSNDLISEQQQPKTPALTSAVTTRATTPSIPNLPSIPSTPGARSGASTPYHVPQDSNANSANSGNGNESGSNNQFQSRSQESSEDFVGSTTYGLLRALPSSTYFGAKKDHVFDAAKLVELFGNLPNIPRS